MIEDTGAAERGLLRIIDETGEDYLYPEDYFVPVELPKAADALFNRAAR